MLLTQPVFIDSHDVATSVAPPAAATVPKWSPRFIALFVGNFFSWPHSSINGIDFNRKTPGAA